MHSFPITLGEARKKFKTCVNILSTIKNENNEKYLILRKRYFKECPQEEVEDNLHLLVNPDALQSPGSRSGISEYDLPLNVNSSLGEASNNLLAAEGGLPYREYDFPPNVNSSLGEVSNNLLAAESGLPYREYDLPSKINASLGDATSNFLAAQSGSPSREPPPYKPPPKVIHHTYQNQQKYDECVDEFKSALLAIGLKNNETDAPEGDESPPEIPPKSKPSKDDSNAKKQAMRENASVLADEDSEDKENIAALLSTPLSSNAEHTRTLDKQISVKEATKKFNRIASEEEANKLTSPPAKKKPEKVSNTFILFLDFTSIIRRTLLDQIEREERKQAKTFYATIAMITIKMYYSIKNNLLGKIVQSNPFDAFARARTFKLSR